jgi:hypothetical protein
MAWQGLEFGKLKDEVQYVPPRIHYISFFLYRQAIHDPRSTIRPNTNIPAYLIIYVALVLAFPRRLSTKTL